MIHQGRGIKGWLRWLRPARSGTFWRDHSLDVIGTVAVFVFTITAMSPFWKGMV